MRVAVTCALLAAVLTPAVHAADAHEKRAAELYAAAEKALDREDCTAALPKLTEAIALDPKPNAYLEIAGCYRDEGKFEDASHAYATLVARFPNSNAAKKAKGLIVTLDEERQATAGKKAGKTQDGLTPLVAPPSPNPTVAAPPPPVQAAPAQPSPAQIASTPTSTSATSTGDSGRIPAPPAATGEGPKPPPEPSGSHWGWWVGGGAVVAAAVVVGVIVASGSAKNGNEPVYHVGP